MLNILTRFRIGTRLALGFGSLILLALSMAGLGAWQIHTMRTVADRLAREDAEMLVLTQGWLRAIESNAARNWVVFFAVDPTIVAKAKEEMAGVVQAQNERMKRIAELPLAPEAKEMVAEITRERGAYQAMRNELLKRMAGGEKVQAEVLAKLYPASQSYLASVRKIADFQAAQTEQARQRAEDAAMHGFLVLGAGTLLILVAGAALAWVMTRSVVKPVRASIGAAEAIAGGDLTVQLEAQGRDEFAQLTVAMRQMLDSLRNVVGQVRESSDSIATGSDQIATGNADLSERTERQASSVQETAATMQQLTSTVKENAGAAQQAAQLADAASTVAQQGGQAIGDVVGTMHEISASSRRIGDIIGVIDGIAFQTNILALNAAVEAARAGEQGRGFAVVAAEVRALAQRSADAAREIKQLITDSVQKVQAGSEQVDRAGRTMEDIVSQVRRVNELIAGITTSTIQQHEGIEQVGAAVGLLDQSTQQNAALVEESAAAAASLNQQAARLVQAVRVFRLQPATT